VGRAKALLIAAVVIIASEARSWP